MKQLHKATTEALQQVQQLIDACDRTQYNQPCIHSESGIGRHVRHILDHFLALQAGLTENLIDYNRRHRDTNIENDPEIASQLVNNLLQWFTHSEHALADRNIQVESEISISQEQNMSFESTINRELCYLINHTIHHVAYAKLVAKNLGVSLDSTIGIAPSTATYLRQQAS